MNGLRHAAKRLRTLRHAEDATASSRHAGKVARTGRGHMARVGLGALALIAGSAFMGAMRRRK
jgi:hypothetical protein